MSQRLLDVLAGSRAKGGPLLLRLVLDAHAWGSKTTCHPTISTLVRLTRFSPRQVIRCLETLERLGEITVLRATGRPNRYTLTSDARVTSDAGVTSDARVMGTSDIFGKQPVTPVSPEVEQVEKKQRRRASLRTGKHALPRDVVLSDEWHTLATGLGCQNPVTVFESFRDHWHGTGAAKKDWTATWRNWVRNAHGRFGPCVCAHGGLTKSTGSAVLDYALRQVRLAEEEEQHAAQSGK